MLKLSHKSICLISHNISNILKNTSGFKQIKKATLKKQKVERSGIHNQGLIFSSNLKHDSSAAASPMYFTFFFYEAGGYVSRRTTGEQDNVGVSR